MKLTILIPCLNEEQSIAQVIQAIPKHIEGIEVIDILVIDDGSTDATVQKAQEQGARVVSHPVNRGVGVAFQTGIQEALKARADVIVNMDGDGQFNPQDIPKLIQPILEQRADFVTASRFKDPSLAPKMPFIKRWGNKRIAKLVSFLIGKSFDDVSCGFRAYSQETALKLNLFGRFTYTQETFLDLAFKNLTMVEVPLEVRGVREFGKSRVASNLWVYAVNSSKIIFRTYRDYKPMRFFGGIASLFFLISGGFATFFFSHYFMTGSFSPHLWAGFISGFGFLASFLFFLTGLLADMMDRIRRNQEALLYFEKKRQLH